MRTFSYKDPDGSYVMFFFNNADSEYISENQLNQLKPFVSHVLHANEKGFNPSFTVSEKGYVFATQNDAEEARAKCDATLEKRIIVCQSMGPDGAPIHHRPLHFSVKEGNILRVQYAEFGAFNNFDAAIEDLKQIYPTVEPQSMPSKLANLLNDQDANNNNNTTNHNNGLSNAAAHAVQQPASAVVLNQARKRKRSELEMHGNPVADLDVVEVHGRQLRASAGKYRRMGN